MGSGKGFWNLRSFKYKRWVADCKSYDKDSTLQMSNSAILYINGVMRITNAPKAYTHYDKDSTLQMSNSEFDILLLILKNFKSARHSNDSALLNL